MTKNLTKACLILLFLLRTGPPVFAADGGPASLTLKEAVSRAIHTNPEYDVAAHRKNAAHQRLLQARSLYLPSLDLQAQAGREEVSGQETEAWQRRGSLTLTQLLFDGWGTRNEIESQKHLAQSAQHRVEETGEFLGLDVVQAYLDVLRQRSLLKVARVNLEDHAGILEKISAGAEAGTATRADASQAEARLRNAQANIFSVEQDLRAAEALFNQKAGEMPGDLSYPDVPRDKLPVTVEEAIHNALMDSPTLAALHSDLQSAEAELAGTAAAFYPRVELEVNGSTDSNLSGIQGDQESFSALAVARWNLFRGGADTERRREFAHRHAESRARAESASRQVEKNVRDTWAARDAAESRAQEFTHQALADSKVVAAYLDQFTLGRRTLLDVLNAQDELFISRTNKVNALYAEAFAVFRLFALQGKMLALLGLEPPVINSQRGS